ncbi:uncharacterized protein LOC132286715 isoform X3 [Cornus florida]|uniref:uncharacterized protein LOC132286715 isoform X3 n=1 Tax=Cornus florida TaxID=4283 RepID=UPI0028999CB6|nr:uncharacterized protein LOC132286715 isoform X3 [Cornus florida]
MVEDDLWQQVVLFLGRGHEIEARTLEGIQIEHVEKGLIRCKFVVPKHLSDKDGNWQVGAMATLIDVIGSAAIFTCTPHLKGSVVIDISYFSTAKIQEEVEIEAKVVGQTGKILGVVVVISKKGGGEMISLGKQWMASTNQPHTPPTNINPSKL